MTWISEVKWGDVDDKSVTQSFFKSDGERKDNLEGKNTQFEWWMMT
jgi:hypothetical protein